MGGITFTRLTATRVLLAGTALLTANIADARSKHSQHHHHYHHHRVTRHVHERHAEPAKPAKSAAPVKHVASASAGQAAPDETAMAVPRLSRPGSVGVALPEPLDPVDAARLRRIFEAQRTGHLDEAYRESDQIDTSKPLGRAMLGFVLSDRYLGPFTRPGAAELSGWLIYYADQPDARAIYNLLLKRLPKGAEAPPPPPEPKWQVKPPTSLRNGPDPAIGANPRSVSLERSVRDRLDAGQTDGALQLIAHRHGLGARDAAKLRAEVAQDLFATNHDDDALTLAKSAFKESDGAVGLAPYIAGLAAWRLGRNDEAGTYFEAAAIAKSSPPALRAAGSFWAARARLRAGDTEGAKFWTMRAAEEPGTFYGLLARRALGQRVAKAVSVRKKFTSFWAMRTWKRSPPRRRALPPLP